MPRTELITQATRLVTEVTRENWNNSRCVTLLVFSTYLRLPTAAAAMIMIKSKLARFIELKKKKKWGKLSFKVKSHQMGPINTCASH